MSTALGFGRSSTRRVPNTPPTFGRAPAALDSAPRLDPPVRTEPSSLDAAPKRIGIFVAAPASVRPAGTAGPGARGAVLVAA